MNKTGWKFAALLLVGMQSADLGAQARMPQVGVIFSGSVSPSSEKLTRDFLDGMRAQGYVNGKNFRYELRYADGSQEKANQLARELVGAKVDVIVVTATLSSQAVAKATASIPIVFTHVSDPVAAGLVRSLAAPGGNITGFSLQLAELRPKRFEILHELAPTLKRVGILRDLKAAEIYKESAGSIERAARDLGKQILLVGLHSAADFEPAFLQLGKWRAEALMIYESPWTAANRTALYERALKERLPAMCGTLADAEAGCLIAYGADYGDISRRSAAYVARILKGEKPAALPVQNPTRFELSINLKTAKALGLAIPQSLLSRADKVIE